MTEILYKDLSYQIVGAAMEVHRILGPGFLETVYEIALAHELSLRGLPHERQRHLPITYKGVSAGDYIADLIVDNQIIIELKARSRIEQIHRAQAHHYLAATGLRLAIILNFGTNSLEHQRVVR